MTTSYHITSMERSYHEKGKKGIEKREIKQKKENKKELHTGDKDSPPKRGREKGDEEDGQRMMETWATVLYFRG